jgi:phosphoserine phosphatase
VTPTKVEVNIQKTTRRSMSLTLDQVENIIAKWAAAHHGFPADAVVEFDEYSYRGCSVTSVTVESVDPDYLDDET